MIAPYLARFIRRDFGHAPRRRRDALRRLQLRFWLRLMEACERRGQHDSDLYYWLARRAMSCNPWRKTWS